MDKVLNFKQGRVPLLISMPHAGLRLTPAVEVGLIGRAEHHRAAPDLQHPERLGPDQAEIAVEGAGNRRGLRGRGRRLHGRVGRRRGGRRVVLRARIAGGQGQRQRDKHGGCIKTHVSSSPLRSRRRA